MNTKIRFMAPFMALVGLVVFFQQCTPINSLPFTIDCGPDYVYNQVESACIPVSLTCDPACPTDQKCVLYGDKTKCVSRIVSDPNQPKTTCAVTCGDREICLNGQCVPAPCDPPCQAGSICSYGVCTPTSECHPPCQQTGYVCVNGLCERICPKPCENGTVCVDGKCQKPCNPACQTGFFCNDGKCQKLEDADGDGYRSDRDCDDKDKAINPGAIEICNGKDDDCDGLIDNIVPKDCYEGPGNTLGVGPCRSGRLTCDKGVQKCIPVGTNEKTKPDDQETCKNNLDDDCNGQIDDGCP